jgi:hypothetical protein
MLGAAAMASRESVSLVVSDCKKEEAADEAEDTARLGAHIQSHALRGVVDAVDGRVDGLIDEFGLIAKPRRHVLHVVENRVHSRHRRCHLSGLEAGDERHHPAERKKTGDAHPGDHHRFEHAHGSDDSEDEIGCTQVT